MTCRGMWTLALTLPWVAALASAQTESELAPARKELPVPGTSDLALPHGQGIALGFVALVGVATLIIQMIVFLRARGSGDATMRMATITLIITLAVGMLVIGYDEKQIAPVIGLFGSIVGYLLGRGDRTADQRETSNDEGRSSK